MNLSSGAVCVTLVAPERLINLPWPDKNGVQQHERRLPVFGPGGQSWPALVHQTELNRKRPRTDNSNLGGFDFAPLYKHRTRGRGQEVPTPSRSGWTLSSCPMSDFRLRTCLNFLQTANTFPASPDHFVSVWTLSVWILTAGWFLCSGAFFYDLLSDITVKENFLSINLLYWKWKHELAPAELNYLQESPADTLHEQKFYLYIVRIAIVYFLMLISCYEDPVINISLHNCDGQRNIE